MRNLVVLSVAAVVALTTSPASADELMQKAQETFKPIPSVVPAVKGNAVTRDKIELGKMLFFDPWLSASRQERFIPYLSGPGAGHVVPTEDANHPLVLVDHRQPADLQLFHVPGRLGELIVLSAAMDA